METFKTTSRYFCYLKFKFNYTCINNKNEDALNKELDDFESKNIWETDILKELAYENIYCDEEDFDIKLDLESSDSYYDFSNNQIVITTPTTISVNSNQEHSSYDINFKSTNKNIEVCNNELLSTEKEIILN